MANQIIEVPDISVVKTVNGTKKLFSLRDQRIKSEEELITIGVGSGCMYNGDLYVLKSVKELILSTTTSKNLVTFGWVYTTDIIVDWGDGVVETNQRFHSYKDGIETHNILFYGENTSLTAFNCPNNQLTTLDVSKSIKLENLICGNNQLTTLDLNKNVELKSVNCIDDTPLGQNNEALIDMANSLVDRTGITSGYLYAKQPTTIIKPICDSKNWTIIQS